MAKNGQIQERVAAVQSGRATAKSWVQEALNACRDGERLGAVTALYESEALVAARLLDERRRNGEALGRLAGMPFVVKDNLDVAGKVTTAGTFALRENVAASTASAVSNLLAHDAILLGKANMHELAMGGTTSNALLGVARNPLDERRVPGGSSGGSGAAVAAGMVPLALGTDTAGSIRIPASFCGVAGLRPATPSAVSKSWPDDGLVPCSYELDTVGPIAATVEDLAFLQSALADGTPIEPRLPRRIGVPSGFFTKVLEDQVGAGWAAALEVLNHAGVDLIPIAVDAIAEEATSAFTTLLSAGVAYQLPTYLASLPQPITMAQLSATIAGADVKAIFAHTVSAPPSHEDTKEVLTSVRPRLRYAMRQAVIEAGVEAVIWPTSPICPPLIREGGDIADPEIEIGGQVFSQVWLMIRHTMIGSLLGFPALSLPGPRLSEKISIGIDVMAPDLTEAELLAVGRALEGVFLARSTQLAASTVP